MKSADLTESVLPQVAAALWERVQNIELAAVPERVRRIATHCLLDWLGCALAGSREPLAAVLRDELSAADGVATLPGSRSRASVLSAALINGSAGHALDYDDTGTIGHPSAPVWPAVLAVAEERGLTGAEVLEAFIVGFEVESRVGSLFGRDPYNNGWHTTPLYGVFGSMAATAKLLGLNEQQFGNALGLAASQACGVKANFGTMTKPFHAGHAAERGCLAARLAGRGFTANAAAIEGNQGLLQAMGSGTTLLARLGEQRDRWFLPEVLFKYHAACYLTHSTINNVRAVAGDVAANAVDAIELTVNPSIIDVCGLYDRPQTGLEGKFSLTGTAAMAVHRIDTSAPDSFRAEVVTDPALQATMAKVRIQHDEDLTITQARLKLHTVDGGVLETASDSGVPNEQLDTQEQALLGKFAALAGPILGEAAVTLPGRLLSVDQESSVAELLALTAVP
ncbi:MAG: MmgE/PrpD family protein [Pseudomonadota bacterium]